MIEGRSFGDRKQPGAESLVRVEPLDALVSLQKRFLCQVFGIMSVAHQLPEEVKDALFVKSEQRIESFPRAGFDLLDQPLDVWSRLVHDSGAAETQFGRLDCDHRSLRTGRLTVWGPPLRAAPI